MSQSDREPGGGPEAAQGSGAASPLEWVVAGLSSLLVLAAVGFLLADGLGAPASPPRITVEVDTVTRAGQGYLVEFRAHNAGRTTASAVTVQGELANGAGTVERSEATIDYVPAGGTRGGGLFFTADPRRHRLRIRPEGYERP